MANRFDGKGNLCLSAGANIQMKFRCIEPESASTRCEFASHVQGAGAAALAGCELVGGRKQLRATSQININTKVEHRQSCSRNNCLGRYKSPEADHLH